jgi:hypothetical protein
MVGWSAVDCFLLAHCRRRWVAVSVNISDYRLTMV